MMDIKNFISNIPSFLLLEKYGLPWSIIEDIKEIIDRVIPNLGAGSIAANHYNEGADKRIRVRFNNKIINTGLEKFGALVGDNSRIGANAVLSPGTILEKDSMVRRLELIEQFKEK